MIEIINYLNKYMSTNVYHIILKNSQKHYKILEMIMFDYKFYMYITELLGKFTEPNILKRNHLSSFQ